MICKKENVKLLYFFFWKTHYKNKNYCTQLWYIHYYLIQLEKLLDIITSFNIIKNKN